MDLERFAGVARCYGTQGLQKFSQARVAVVGVGVSAVGWLRRLRAVALIHQSD